MTTNTPQPNVPGDEVDRLLGAYFRAQMPAKWPAPPETTGGSSHPARQSIARGPDPATRSRWALGASVALLIGRCWYLSGRASNGQRRPDTALNENRKADVTQDEEEGHKAAKRA